MTRFVTAPLPGGAGSVLAIWSLVVVVVGGALFAYSIVITVRGRRSRNRRRRPVGRPMPPPPASRLAHPPTAGPEMAPSGGQGPLAAHPMGLPGGQPMGAGPMGGQMPSGPTAGGVPVHRNVIPRARALPSGPSPLALPAPSAQRPAYGLPNPRQLPTGPVAGAGAYGPPAGYGQPGLAGAPGSAGPPAYGPGGAYGGPRPFGAPGPYGGPGPHGRPGPPTASTAGPLTPGPGTPAVGGLGANVGPYGGPASGGAGTYGTPAIYGTPALPIGSSDPHAQGGYVHGGYADPSGAGAPNFGGPGDAATSTTYGTPAIEAADERPALTAGPATGYPGGPAEAPVTGVPAVGSSPSTYGGRRGAPARPKAPRPKRADECSGLRAECEQLTLIAAAAATAAADAATEASTAHADYMSAQRTADEARRAHQHVVREAGELAAQLAGLERSATDDQQRLQAETSHAAFAAFRRGDITAEQLREVFKRAEGWTPEHDRLSSRSTELRAEESDVVRVRDAAIMAEEAAAERARTTAVAARALDEQARVAASDGRGRCAAAEACEQRLRRR